MTAGWLKAPTGCRLWWVRREGLPDDVMRVTALSRGAVVVDGVELPRHAVDSWLWHPADPPVDRIPLHPLARVSRLADDDGFCRLCSGPAGEHAEDCHGTVLPALERAVAELTAQLSDALTDADDARVLLGGSPTAPTQAQLRAHDDANGVWLLRSVSGLRIVRGADAARLAGVPRSNTYGPRRWWAVAADGVLVPAPEV